VEQLAVGAGADLIDDSRLQIKEDAAGHVLASTSLREEGVEGIITTANGLVGRHLAIRLNAVLQAVELPAGIAHLCKGTFAGNEVSDWSRESVNQGRGKSSKQTGRNTLISMQALISPGYQPGRYGWK
jgi:hypothetical protein